MADTVTRTHAYDALPLAPPADLELPVPGERLGSPKHNGVGEWSTYLGTRALQRTLGVLPRPLFRAATACGARAARLASPKRTRIARDFVRTALPHLDRRAVDRLVLGTWRHMFEVTVTFDRMFDVLLQGTIGDHFDLETSAPFDALCTEEARAARRAGGKGVLFVGTHGGYWEAAAPLLSALGFRPLYVVGKPPRNHPMALYVQRKREQPGMVMLGRRGAMKHVPAVLRAGGCVVLLLDQRARKRPIWSDFFGRPAATDRSVGVLVRRLRAPVVFAGCYGTQERYRYRMRFQTVVEPDELAGLSPEEVVDRVQRESEQLILTAPEQYFWLHDRFKGSPPRPTPPGEAPEPAPERPSEPALPTR